MERRACRQHAKAARRANRHGTGTRAVAGRLAAVPPAPALASPDGCQQPPERAKKFSGSTGCEAMLADPDVRIWYDNLARGSRNTAKVRLRRLKGLCGKLNATPNQLIDIAKRNPLKVADLLASRVAEMEAAGYAPGYIQEQLKTAASWLQHFGLRIPRKIKVSSPNSTPTLDRERIPDTDEMARIYDCAGLRAGAIVALMSCSGVRPEVVGNDDASNGLRVRDLPDITIRDGRAEAAGTPCRVVVRPELSKARHQYFSFVGRFAASKIVEYLNHRIARGERLDADSPVIAPDHLRRSHRGHNAGKAFVGTPQVSRLVSQAIRKAFGRERKLRPYALRAYFDTQLLIAESRGLVAHDFRVFWMGHAGNMEARYTTNKGILSNIMMNEMRVAYGRAEQLLEPAGAAPERQRPADLAVPVPRQGDTPGMAGTGRSAAGPPNQKATDADEGAALINQGWRFVAVLPNGKVVLERHEAPPYGAAAAG